MNATRVHQVPELEALLPPSIAGRPLSRWSVRGRCWLELTISRPPADLDAFVAGFETPNDQHKIDLTNLTYGVAGRSDTSKDPPYFVFGAARPQDRDETSVAVALLFGGSSFNDITAADDLANYQEQTIAGKQVYVGSADMLAQTEHQRGRPFLYQNDDYMFLVITNDDAWAADAIRQLP